MGDLGVTFGSLAVLGPPAAPQIARLGAELGYRSFWTVEATGTDAFTLLGSVATAVSNIDLATGIVPVQVRSPALTAMSAATLQALNPDRDVFVGVGVSAPAILHQHGIESTRRPIALMREYVTLLRACLSGEKVDFGGEFYNIKRFTLGVRLGGRRPKIVMAALNPQMLKLAGELADGVLLNYLPASHVAQSVEQVRKGGDAKIFAYVHAAVGDVETSANSARRDLFNYAMADGYARMFSRAGFTEEVAALRERQQQRDREGALAAISERMIQSIDFIGSASEVGSFVQSYLDEGVEHAVLMPLPWGEDRRAVVEETMRAAAGVIGGSL